ncbi:MAG: hypothetical protein ABW061_10615, partial [Polyangiaceae bacterium]
TSRGAALRARAREALDQAGTLDAALGRKLIAAANCAYFPPAHPEIDIYLGRRSVIRTLARARSKRAPSR